MTSDLPVVHIIVESVLAGLAWVLFRRQRAAQRLLSALEAEHGLMQKRFEAATKGLHIRVLQVERQARAGNERRAPQVVELPRRPRGEQDLLLKVRQLTQD